MTKPSDPTRTDKIVIRVTPAEKQKIKRWAQGKYVGVSAALRQLIMAAIEAEL